MTIKELYEKCGNEIKNGNGNVPVYFDSEAMCFDTHLVEIKTGLLETAIEKYFILSFDNDNTLYHYNR